MPIGARAAARYGQQIVHLQIDMKLHRDAVAHNPILHRVGIADGQIGPVQCVTTVLRHELLRHSLIAFLACHVEGLNRVLQRHRQIPFVSVGASLVPAVTSIAGGGFSQCVDRVGSRVVFTNE